MQLIAHCGINYLYLDASSFGLVLPQKCYHNYNNYLMIIVELESYFSPCAFVIVDPIEPRLSYVSFNPSASIPRNFSYKKQCFLSTFVIFTYY